MEIKDFEDQNMEDWSSSFTQIQPIIEVVWSLKSRKKIRKRSEVWGYFYPSKFNIKMGGLGGVRGC